MQLGGLETTATRAGLHRVCKTRTAVVPLSRQVQVRVHACIVRKRHLRLASQLFGVSHSSGPFQAARAMQASRQLEAYIYKRLRPKPDEGTPAPSSERRASVLDGLQGVTVQLHVTIINGPSGHTVFPQRGVERPWLPAATQHGPSKPNNKPNKQRACICRGRTPQEDGTTDTDATKSRRQERGRAATST